jgi:3-phosphoshikimate 1-carboxyvinyltransferase
MIQKVGNIARIHPLNKPISAIVNVPGSKSYTNRALIMAALAEGVSTLRGISDSNDSKVLIKLLQQLGIEIDLDKDTAIVKGCAGQFPEFKGELDVEDAGTVMRFLTALCCIIPGEITLRGSERMHQRPVKDLVEALKRLGAKIEYLESFGLPPLLIKGGKIAGGVIKVNGTVSSQFISALLMITPLLPLDTRMIIEGETVSAPYIDMTLSAMHQFGIKVDGGDGKFQIEGRQCYAEAEYKVEGDASSASYILAIAAISKSAVIVNNVPGNSVQSDAHFADLLQQMGCIMSKKGSTTAVVGTGELNAITIDMQDMPDTAQTLAVVAAFAKGETIITGLSTLQLKESKRIDALQAELTKMGIKCEAGDDYIKIKGGKPKGAFINTYDDHRMAMAFAVAGVRIDGMTIESPEVVKKSFPTFWTTLQTMGINLEME